MPALVITNSVKAYKTAITVVCIYQAYYESMKSVKAAKVLLEIAYEILI